MSGPPSGALTPIVVLVLFLAVDAWVYADAKAHHDRRAPVAFSAGSLRVDTPVAWLLGCLILWVVFVPLYLTCRRQAD